MSAETVRLVYDEVSYGAWRRFPELSRQLVQVAVVRWFVDHPKLYAHILNLPEGKAEQELRHHLRNWALWRCHHLRAKLLGYEFEDLHFYSIGSLKELIPVAFFGGNAGRQRDPGEAAGPRRPSEGGNGIVMVFDVERALEMVDAHTRSVLYAAAGNGWRPTGGQPAEAWDREVRRALRRVQDVLGGPAPRPDEGDVVPEEYTVDPTRLVELYRQGAL